MCKSELTENQQLLRRSNEIHERLSVLWFDTSLMSRDSKKYSSKQLEEFFEEITRLTQERIMIWRTRAENFGHYKIRKDI
jgi:hypothetical protein